jgi:hypothetical protein
VSCAVCSETFVWLINCAFFCRRNFDKFNGFFGGYYSVNLRNAQSNNEEVTNKQNLTTPMILICYFSKEQYELPEDDKQYAIETCRSLLSVLVF